MPGLFHRRQEANLLENLQQRLTSLESGMTTLFQIMDEKLRTAAEIRHELDLTKAEIIARVQIIMAESRSDDFSSTSSTSSTTSLLSATEGHLNLPGCSGGGSASSSGLDLAAEMEELQFLRRENLALREALQCSIDREKRTAEATLLETNMGIDSGAGADLDRKLPTINPISRQRIDEFVEQMLQDPAINISYLPDVVERQIYRNVFQVMLGTLDKLLHDSSIRFLGHEITMSLRPLGPASLEPHTSPGVEGGVVKAVAASDDPLKVETTGTVEDMLPSSELSSPTATTTANEPQQ